MGTPPLLEVRPRQADRGTRGRRKIPTAGLDESFVRPRALARLLAHGVSPESILATSSDWGDVNRQ